MTDTDRTPAESAATALAARAAVPPVPWRTRDAFAVAGLGIGGVLVALLVGTLLGWRGEMDSTAFAVMLLLEGLLPGAAALLYLRLRFPGDHGYLWRPGGMLAPRWAPALGVGVGLGLAWWLIVDVAVVGGALALTGAEPPEVQEELRQALATPGPVQIAGWLAVVAVAPLAEEIVFRGILFLGLARWVGSVPSAIISSLVFGLVHVQPELTGWAFMTVVAFPFGLFACWLLHRFGSLWLPVGAHAGTNFASLAAAAAIGQL